MHKIKTISVTGFRRQSEAIRLDLSEKANFLIGRNGTGKTSLINLINACLTIDQHVLTETIYERVIIKFKQSGKSAVPSIEVEKLDYRKTGAYVRYSVRDSATSVPETYELSFGKARIAVRHPDGQRRIVPRRDNLRELKNSLSSLFKHTWLSLHRGHEVIETYSPYIDEFEDDRSEFLSSVDSKLREVLGNLSQYFFTLDRKVSEQTRLFQKDWFRSFLATDTPNTEILGQQIDFSEEKETVAAIFEKFEVPKDSYEDQLNNHILLGEKALEEWRKGGGLPISTFFNLYDVVRLHGLVEQWQDLQTKQKEILIPKSDFISIASKMLYRKSIFLDQGNDVVVSADDSLEIPVEKLSSGEKQLLIFLAETLLQQKQPYIFLADEPELSLHVEWQEQLVANLLIVNPNAQVLFATHSPDIVGPYSDHLFSMESLVK